MSELDYYEILRDLHRRRKVWEAIAELYQDPGWMDAVVRDCRESGYSWDELDRIARYEVAPAIWSSLEYYMGVGEPFFGSDWLAGRAVKTVGRPYHALMVRLLGRRMMRPLEQSWREVERRFKSGDGGGADSGVAELSGETRATD
jgi:hypothetical protein